MRKRYKAIEAMTDYELRLNLYITQGIILLVSALLSVWLFDNMFDFYSLFVWNPIEVIGIGGGSALFIVLVDYIAMKLFPLHWFDDGGINSRLFRGITVSHLAFITLLIGFAEELLFRGIVQTHFGIGFASVVFALLHIRYIMKPFLLMFVLLISIAFGYLFEYTGNLLVTICAHFLVDFIMGLYLRGEVGDDTTIDNAE